MRFNAVLSSLTSCSLAVALAVAPITAEAAPEESDEAAEGEQPEGEEAQPEGEGEGEGEEPAGEEGGEEAGEEGGEEPPPEEGEVVPDEEEVLPDAPPPEEATPEEPPPPEVEAPDPMADKPEEPMVNGKPRKGIGLMIAGGVTLLGGITSTVVFHQVTLGCSLDGPLGCRHKNQDQFLIPLGAAITLLGTMLLAVGVGYHVHYRKWERWTPADAEKKKRRRGRRGRTAALPAPTLLPGGGGMGWSGKF